MLRFADSTGTLLIQMLLQQQSQKFAPIGFQIGFDVTVGLFARCLGTQMAGDLDEFLIGSLKRLVNRERLCFHKTGPLVLGSEIYLRRIYSLRGPFSSHDFDNSFIFNLCGGLIPRSLLRLRLCSEVLGFWDFDTL